jgi:hypothetical protein
MAILHNSMIAYLPQFPSLALEGFAERIRVVEEPNGRMRLDLR